MTIVCISSPVFSYSLPSQYLLHPTVPPWCKSSLGGKYGKRGLPEVLFKINVGRRQSMIQSNFLFHLCLITVAMTMFIYMRSLARLKWTWCKLHLITACSIFNACCSKNIIIPRRNPVWCLCSKHWWKKDLYLSCNCFWVSSLSLMGRKS